MLSADTSNMTAYSDQTRDSELADHYRAIHYNRELASPANAVVRAIALHKHIELAKNNTAVSRPKLVDMPPEMLPASSIPKVVDDIKNGHISEMDLHSKMADHVLNSIHDELTNIHNHATKNNLIPTTDAGDPYHDMSLNDRVEHLHEIHANVISSLAADARNAYDGKDASDEDENKLHVAEKHLLKIKEHPAFMDGFHDDAINDIDDAKNSQTHHYYRD
jgi:hypothetical protein